MSIFSELKRRKVFKVGLAYLVAAWIVIQVVTTVAPQLGIPAWAPRLVTLLVLLGFPVALVLSWIFDVGPEGIRADRSSRGNRVVIVVGVVLAALALGWYWKGWPRAGSEAAGGHSIAVLPFVNMSGDPKKDYFSDGISEEILDVLARSPDLEVAARTSSFAFEGQHKEIPEIARALHVRMVLEGSVRQDGHRVRITAQLVDARTGYHLWSQTYDRQLTDIFAVQDEIARAVGKELQARVAGGRPSEAADSAARPVSPVAHDLYLRGLSKWRTRNEDSLWAAVADFDSAAETDPGFAHAWAGLALVYAVIGDYTTRISNPEAYRRGRDAAEHALALDPGLPEAFAAMGIIADYQQGRTGTALALLRRAVALSPSFAPAQQWLGTSLALDGKLEEGLAALGRASELDPLSSIVANNYSAILMAAGRYAEASTVIGHCLDADIGSPLCLQRDALARLMEDGPGGVRPLLSAWAKANGRAPNPDEQAVLAALEGKGDRRAAALRLAATPMRVQPDPATASLFTIQETPAVLVLLGARDVALDYLEREADSRPFDVAWSMFYPALDPVRCDPRFRAIAERVDYVDARAPAVCAGGG